MKDERWKLGGRQQNYKGAWTNIYFFLERTVEQTFKWQFAWLICNEIHYFRLFIHVYIYRRGWTMAAIGVTNDGVLQTANPFFTFFEVSGLKVECFAIDGDRKGRVILVIDTNNRTFQTNAAPTNPSYHFFTRLQKKKEVNPLLIITIRRVTHRISR